MRGTDLTIGIQVLLVQHKSCQDLNVEAGGKKDIIQDTLMCDFLSEQRRKSYNFRGDLLNLLSSLGNACGHFDSDNLHNFIQEKGMPVLNIKRSPYKAFRTLKEQYLSLIESYKKILSFKALPIRVESIMLRHLAELQGIACYLIKHKLQAAKVNVPSLIVA